MSFPYCVNRGAAALLAFGLVLSSCGSTGDTTTEPDSTDTTAVESATSDDTAAADGDPDTTAGVDAAQWGDNVTITMSDGEFRFESDGVPNHELPDEFLVPTTGSFTPPVTEDEVNVVATEIAVVESPVDQTITLTPVYSETVTNTSLGIIGVAISGAQLFNDYEDTDREFVAVDDSFSIDGVGFTDSCNGHPLALLADGTGNGNYHYHGVPYCITDVVDTEGQHSTIIGILLDGFPFYGNKDADGETITSAGLDECSGHFGATPEFPEGIYHYHLTDDAAPYTVDCYHGVVEASSSESGESGERPDGPPPEDE